MPPRDMAVRVVQDVSGAEELINQGWEVVSKDMTESGVEYLMKKYVENEIPIIPY